MTGVISCPEGKAEAGARAGGRAVARYIARPFDVEMLRGTGGADPHADLRAAGIELVPRQGLQRIGVLARAGVDDLAVELLVDDEMAEPAGADDADAGVTGVALYRLANGLAKLIAAPRRRLVRREIGGDEHRNHRQRLVLHQPFTDKGKGVPLAFSRGESVR